MTKENWPNVSRETSERLAQFETLVAKWSPKINLISRGDLSHIAERHINDSLQVWSHAPKDAHTWVDLGSGGGFPAIPIAILAKEHNPGLKVICVESDQRKCAFLRTASRELGLGLFVENTRIEEISALNASVISARALAPLDILLSFCLRHLSNTGVALFMKGQRWQEEVEMARKTWNFELQAHISQSAADARILECRGIAHV